jgi:quercetin dioxygenase-like cupin family protein
MIRATATALLLIVAAPGQDAPPAPPPPPDLRFDVPAGGAPQQVQLRGINLAPGETIPLHIHPGVEMAYIVAGTIQFRMGNETLIKHAGDSTMVPRGTPHAATNIGKDIARVVSTFVVDQGATLRIAVNEDGKPRP